MSNLAIEAAKKLLGTSNSSLRGEIKVNKEISNITQLNEELTPAHERKADKMVEAGNSYHQDNFIQTHATPGTLEKFQFDGDVGHKVLRIPISLNQDNTEPSHNVKNFLEGKGFHIKDTASYRSGIVHKSVVTGNPDKGIPYRSKLVPHKIGSVLEKHGAPDSVMHSFLHDPVRIGSGKTDYDLVISNHPHDVYGMSTGRGWTSCADMNNPKGYASQKMKDEINNHTHVAYLVDRGGDYNKNAIARLAFKHHTAVSAKADNYPINHQTLISEKRVYGQAPTDFRNVAEHEMGKLFPVKDDIYMKNPNIYNDSGELIHVPEGKTVSAESLDTAWKKFPSDSKHQLYEYVDTEGKYKSKKLREVQHALKDIMQEPTGNFQEDIGRLRESTYGLDRDQRLNGIGKNNKFDREVLSNQTNKVMKSFDVHNTDHQLELKLFDVDHPLRYHIYNGMESNIPAIKNANDFETGNRIHKILGNRTNEKLPVHPEHSLGDDPVKTLAKAGVLRDVDDFRKAYHTFPGKKHENWYSLVHRLNDENVPNAHHALNDALETLRGRNSSNYRDELSMATAYHYMSPAARNFYGKELGHNPEDILEKHKDYVAQYFKE